MSSYGALWRARWALMRPGNAAMGAVGVATGAILAGAVAADIDVVLAAALAAFLLTAFGNVINDLRDIDVDREAHPRRPLPSGAIDATSAKAFAVLLLALGLWEAFAAAGWGTLAFAAINVAALGAYEWRLKQHGLIGNITVATLVASTFAFGAYAVAPEPRSWGLVWALAVMAFLTNLARELLKDIQDLESDREERQTFPMEAGRPTTLLLAFFLVQVAVVLSLVAWWYAPGNRWWGFALLAAAIGFVVAISLAWVDVRRGQQGLKLAMLMALVAFLLATV